MKYTASIIRFEALEEADLVLWRQWQIEDPRLASPFLHPRFSQIAAAHSPDSFVAKIFGAEEGEEATCLGFYPFQRRGSAIYPIAAPMNDYHGVVGPAGKVLLLDDVARMIGGKRFVVSSWLGGAKTGTKLTACKAILPASGYDDWYAERLASRGKYFKDKARARRSMARELGDVRVVSGICDHGLLEQLLKLKSAQYKRTGKHDVLGPEWTRGLLHALMDEPEETGNVSASLAAMYAGDKLLAMEYSLHADDQYHFWFPVYLEAGARFSPGILLSMETMQDRNPFGYRVFDYGFSGETYKKYFVNSSVEVVEETLLLNGLISRLGQLATRALNSLPSGRFSGLGDSVRRRWAAIEAAEPTRLGRIKGALLAARRAVSRLGERES